MTQLNAPILYTPSICPPIAPYLKGDYLLWAQVNKNLNISVYRLTPKLQCFLKIPTTHVLLNRNAIDQK